MSGQIPTADLRKCLLKHCTKSEQIQAKLQRIDEDIARSLQKGQEIDRAQVRKMTKIVDSLKIRSDAISTEIVKKCGLVCESEIAMHNARMGEMKRFTVLLEKMALQPDAFHKRAVSNKKSK
jgi:hypothetical protein